MGSGIVTALPLFLFTKSAEKVTLSLLGILQCISPTLSLLTGGFLFHEELTKAHFIAFLFIWAALVTYTFLTVSNRMQVKTDPLPSKSKGQSFLQK